MMRTSHCRRPGLSLTEVLVALFVMALGIISLMTLFPLGAVQMGQALRDDRSGQTASQADGMVRLWWQTEVVEKPGAEDNFWLAMDTPGLPLATKVPVSPAVYDNAPSYPVFLDPIGFQARNGLPIQQNWIGGTPGNLARRSTFRTYSGPTPNLNLSVRACSMMDDITFTETGIPDTASGSISGNVVREGAFNWCAVIQRPNNANRYTADFKICVFHTKGLYGGHIPGISAVNEFVFNLPPLPPGNGGVLGSATLAGTQVVLNVPVGNLPIRSGSWIMDGSNSAVTNFYRIQSITDNGASTILELDTPLKGTTPITQMYIIRGLADVFDRPQLTASGYSRQAP